MTAAFFLNLALSLLGAVLNSLNVAGTAPNIIADIQAAIAKLQGVQNTPVSYSQLESLRVTPLW